MWRLASVFAWPLVLLYALGIRLKNVPYDFHLRKPRQLRWPVLSVGNLSVGGTGKTPMVLLLARLLKERGWDVDVLSRGYGRSGTRVLRVDPDATAERAMEEFGDEPFLLARQGIPVYVGADRHQVGLLAENDKNTEGDAATLRAVHILDDGFQHRKLARAVDIVLLQRADLKDDMLPVGRLREPLRALERADICVLHAEDADLKNRVLQLMGRDDPSRVWIVDRRTTVPMPLPDTSNVLAFCGIGDPSGFFRGLGHAGINVAKALVFRDHHVYTSQDVDRLKAAVQESRVQALITTEKDSIRLACHLRAELEKVLPFIVAGLDVSLRQEVRAMETLDSLLAVSKNSGGSL